MTFFNSASFYSSQFELWQAAKQFPKITQAADYDITFTIGVNNFGFVYGDYDRRYTGPVMDLTGATVSLKCNRMPEKPSLIQAAVGEPWSLSSTIFDVEASITDDENGVAVVSLTDVHTNVIGNVLAMLKVVASDEKITIPGYLRMTFLEKF
jgi:hypothetical protein